ncbi:hypothetical protein DV515_00007732 [Chloebia gouldiae]|uniref:Uncharacterized protein n=1 Tax=Chloebia gouldiae TaxID=44316 RepID=A0A3L8SHG1_CHLGU|nr:hypothetical protein DV515_00007732 [Chloebia gouldiae]
MDRPQPYQNVWVTLAQTLQQENICLSTAAAKDPMSTCLVGIPWQAGEFPAGLNKHRSNVIPESHTPQPHKDQRQVELILKSLEEWLRGLPRMAQEPQELELLGSSPAAYCVHFSGLPNPSNPDEYHIIKQYRGEFTARRWCQNTSHIRADNPSHSSPKSLPKGLFLICGDRAWAGIVSWLLGGPCTIGRLSVLTPNQTLIGEWTHKNRSANKMQKRSADNLDANCNSEIFHWAKSKRIAVSLFFPWVAVAKALGELGHLECWVVKQANLTSAAISSLLENEEITRQAMLQNRAAIDFPLLLHGHECKEFKGLCCVDLTAKAPNIHSALRSMNSLIRQVKQESEDWFKELCKGWGFTGWWTSIVRSILLLLVILFLVTLAFGILSHLIFKAIKGLIPCTSEVNHTKLANLRRSDYATDCR